MKLFITSTLLILSMSCSSAPTAILKKSGKCGSAKAKTFSTNLDYLKANSSKYNDFSDEDQMDFTRRLQDLSDEELEDFVRTMGERQNYKPSAIAYAGAMDWVKALVGGFRNTASNIQSKGFAGALVSDIGSAWKLGTGLIDGNPAIGAVSMGSGDVAPPVNGSINPMASGGGGVGGVGGESIQVPNGVNGPQNVNGLLGGAGGAGGMTPQTSNLIEQEQYAESSESPDGC